ncbi:MAG: archaeosortase A [Halorientalis sp.]
MLEPLLGALAWLTRFSDPLAWLVVGTFSMGTLLEWYDLDRTWARRLTVAGWVGFAVFWVTLIYHFAVVQKSIVEGVGTLVAVPAALYAGYLLAGGRDSLFVLSRAVAVMGLVYLPFETIVAVRRTVIEAVTRQTELVMALLGYEPLVVNSATVPHAAYEPFRSTFMFYPEPGHAITYTIVTACTGIGSMAIFAGLVAAVDASPRRKLRALAVSIPVIYVLNIARNVFIAVSFGYQYLDVFPNLVMTLFAAEDPYKVSYFVADRIIAQSLSVVALVGITWLVVRELPEVLVVIEDVLFMATGREYDLRAAMDLGPVRADGDGD